MKRKELTNTDQAALYEELSEVEQEAAQRIHPMTEKESFAL
jgi:tRNA A37 N6-isopentenylltransferase MiaA